MNVSKARGARQRHSESSDRTKAAANKAASSFGKLLATVLLVLVLAGCICVCVMIVYIMRYSDSRMEIPLEKLSLDYTTTIYAQNAKTGEYEEIEKLYSDENREWADFSEIPKNLRYAFIAAEDERFMDHEGVDWKRTILSFVNLVIPVYSQKSGGSTITQQLIKNVTGDDDVKIERKIREIMEAINLEKEYDKDEILVAYMNTIYLGSHAYGVQTAARTYFNKDVGELTLAECAAIACIPKSPETINPYANLERNEERRSYVLRKMLECGFILQDEYDQAKAQVLDFAYDNYKSALASRQSFFVDEVRRQVVNDLCQKLGWDEQYAKNELFVGGYKIYATVDPELQSIMDKVYAEPETFYQFEGKPDEEQPQSSMIIMENDGRVVGVVGARGDKEYDMSLNYATMTVRQPGSSIKPLTVYSVGIEENLFTYSTIFNDHNLSKDENWTLYGVWSPKNASGNYRGYMTVREAIARSVNTIAAQIIVNYNTPERSFKYATDKYGLSTLVKAKKVNGRTFTDCAAAPMTLGALTDGARLVDMVAAYQAFTNGGYYCKPYFYEKVVDSQGNTVMSHVDESTRIISYETSYIMEKLLESNVTFKGGTCTGMAIKGITVGGKTGTTNENKDKWCIGFSPYYVAGVWTGYDSYTSPYSLPNSNSSVIVWQRVMERIHNEKELSDKPLQSQPGSVVTRRYCPDTGLVAGPNCPVTEIGYYRTGNIPATCPHTPELVEAHGDFSAIVSGVPSGIPSEVSGGDTGSTGTATGEPPVSEPPVSEPPVSEPPASSEPGDASTDGTPGESEAQPSEIPDDTTTP